MSQNLMPQDLDLSFLYDIADGSTEFIVESIDMFLQHTPELLDTITNGIAGDDWVVVAAAAHKLKPNLGFFGMTQCQANIQEVELMAKSGAPDPGLLRSKFDDVKIVVLDNINSLIQIRADKEAEL
jgi:HPt (histidine-containing phosphotransfer) domain-containing protein